MRVFTFSFIAIALVVAPALADDASNSKPSSQPGSSCKDYECPQFDWSGRKRQNAGEYATDFQSMGCKYQSGNGVIYACRYDTRGTMSGGVFSCPLTAIHRNWRRAESDDPPPPQPGGRWSSLIEDQQGTDGYVQDADQHQEDGSDAL